MTVLFVATLNWEWPYARTAALVIFILAGVTDFFDGEIARRYGEVTNFGKLMDPLVDKIMMAAAFISLVPLGAIPGLGGDDGGGARFFDHGIAFDGERAWAGPAGRAPREAQDIVADHHRRIFPGLAFRAGARLRRMRRRLVVPGLESSRSGSGLDYGGFDRLFRPALRLAASRRHRARPIDRSRHASRGNRNASIPIPGNLRSGGTIRAF